MKSIVRLAILVVSMIFFACAATTTSCPPGKKWISYDDLHEMLVTCGLAAYESEKEARACGQEDVAENFHKVFVSLAKMDERVVHHQEFDDDAFLNTMRRYYTFSGELKKTHCSSPATQTVVAQN